MKRHAQQIRNELARCFQGFHLPKEVSLDNEKVLKFLERKNFFSVIFVDKLLFRVYPKKDHYLLEFQNDYNTFFPSLEHPVTEWIRIRLSSIAEIYGLRKTFLDIIEYEMNRTHGEVFGCCSRYVECSDSRKCIHEDFLFSLCCQYRLNLLENRIFYGKHAEALIYAMKELPKGKKLDYRAPTTSRTFKKAPKAKSAKQEQKELF